MLKLPKQSYTVEFKEQAVARVKIVGQVLERLRLRIGPNAFGNAFGSSIIDSMRSQESGPFGITERRHYV